ncbi:MAG: ABC transporter permease [Candidatus Enteromonas sp.]
MGRLFRYELRKILTSKPFWILFAVSLLIPFISIIGTHVGNVIHPDLTDPIYADIEMDSYGFFHLLTYLSIFLPFYIGEDYRNGVIKNVVGRGYSKSQVYWVKWIVGMAVSLIFISVGSLFPYVLGGALEGRWEIQEFYGPYFGWSFVGCACVVAFYLWVSFSFRSAVWPLLISLIVPTAIPILLFALIDMPIMAFTQEPLEIGATSFTWILFGRNAMDEDNGWWINLVTTLVTLPIMPLLGWLTVRKRDIK